MPRRSTNRILEGEYAIVDQYLRAINAAKRTIYFEDQAIGSREVVAALDTALRRSVDVTVLVPLDPGREMAAARKMAETRDFWDALAALGRHERFALAGIATNGSAGEYHHVLDTFCERIEEALRDG